MVNYRWIRPSSDIFGSARCAIITIAALALLYQAPRLNSFTINVDVSAWTLDAGLTAPTAHEAREAASIGKDLSNFGLQDSVT